MTDLLILPAAERDIAEARSWYEGRSPGLVRKFVAGVDAALESVRRIPEGHQVVHLHYRRALVRRFPYAIFYEHEADANRLVIFAVSHGSQDPKIWRDRLP